MIKYLFNIIIFYSPQVYKNKKIFNISKLIYYKIKNK